MLAVYAKIHIILAKHSEVYSLKALKHDSATVKIYSNYSLNRPS